MTNVAKSVQAKGTQVATFAVKPLMPRGDCTASPVTRVLQVWCFRAFRLGDAPIALHAGNKIFQKYNKVLKGYMKLPGKSQLI